MSLLKNSTTEFAALVAAAKGIVALATSTDADVSLEVTLDSTSEFYSPEFGDYGIAVSINNSVVSLQVFLEDEIYTRELTPSLELTLLELGLDIKDNLS